MTLLLLGAGRMGGALIEGWRQAEAFPASELLICDPHPSPEALAAVERGAILNPNAETLARADTVLFAVKPQVWRDIAAEYAPRLSREAVIISVLAGVPIDALSAGFEGRRVARVMPTTAVAVRRGTAAVFAPNAEAASRARRLFEPVATVVQLGDEALMDVATAVAGSAPAYVYAFVEALEAAGVAEGLTPDAAQALVRATLSGAATMLERAEQSPAELRRQVTSPGGTTAAALEVLIGPQGFGPLLREGVAAAVRRGRELAGS